MHIYTKYEVSVTFHSLQIKVQTSCHFKTISQKYSKSSQHILEPHVHIHTKYKASMTVSYACKANKIDPSLEFFLPQTDP